MDKYAELLAALDGYSKDDALSWSAFWDAVTLDTIRDLLAERDALIHDNAEYVGAANDLATENQRLREALRWAAGSLLAACGSGQATELDRFTLDGVTRTGTEILDMADAALAQGQP